MDMMASASPTFTMPAWTPSEVAAAIQWIGQDRGPWAHEHAAILERLATDTRMRIVWKQLGSRKHNGGRFLHPAQPPAHAPCRTADEAQAVAMGELLHLTFCAAADRVSAAKASQVRKERRKLQAEVSTLRRVAKHSTTSAADRDAMLRVADRREDATVAELRADGDPLVIRNVRGDAVERGVQIIVSAFLIERFGARLDRTAATLTAVALGLRKRSNRAGRSAFSRQKRA